MDHILIVRPSIPPSLRPVAVLLSPVGRSEAGSGSGSGTGKLSPKTVCQAGLQESCTIHMFTLRFQTHEPFGKSHSLPNLSPRASVIALILKAKDKNCLQSLAPGHWWGSGPAVCRVDLLIHSSRISLLFFLISLIPTSLLACHPPDKLLHSKSCPSLSFAT